MKRLKLALVAATLCAALYGGYIAYDYATMTDQERMFLANVEALTGDELNNGILSGYVEGKAEVDGADGVKHEISCCLKSNDPKATCDYGTTNCKKIL